MALFNKVLTQIEGLEQPGRILVVPNPEQTWPMWSSRPVSLTHFYGSTLAIVDKEGRLLAYEALR